MKPESKKISCEQEGILSLEVTCTTIGKLNKHLEKRIKVRPFETTPANVSIKYGLTIPLQAYASARIDVMISVPCYVEEIDEVYPQVRKLVDILISKEAEEIRNQGGM